MGMSDAGEELGLFTVTGKSPVLVAPLPSYRQARPSLSLRHKTFCTQPLVFIHSFNKPFIEYLLVIQYWAGLLGN